MKKVLIAIDYNPCSQKVAELGYEHSKLMNAEICIAHAVADVAYYSIEYEPVMGFEGFNPIGSFAASEEQEEEANRFLAAVVKHLGDSNINTKILHGKTHEAILQFAVEYKADLIVLGALTRHSFEKILGDVSSEVVKHAEIPVLIIPSEKQELFLIGKKQDELEYI